MADGAVMKPNSGEHWLQLESLAESGPNPWHDFRMAVRDVAEVPCTRENKPLVLLVCLNLNSLELLHCVRGVGSQPVIE